MAGRNKLANWRDHLGERLLLFVFHPPSPTSAKQTAEAVAQLDQDLMLTQYSPSVCRLGKRPHVRRRVLSQPIKGVVAGACVAVFTWFTVKGSKQASLRSKGLHWVSVSSCCFCATSALFSLGLLGWVDWTYSGSDAHPLQPFNFHVGQSRSGWRRPYKAHLHSLSLLSYHAPFPSVEHPIRDCCLRRQINAWVADQVAVGGGVHGPCPIG